MWLNFLCKITEMFICFSISQIGLNIMDWQILLIVMQTNITFVAVFLLILFSWRSFFFTLSCLTPAYIMWKTTALHSCTSNLLENIQHIFKLQHHRSNSIVKPLWSGGVLGVLQYIGSANVSFVPGAVWNINPASPYQTH